jgi:hypothetical protein
VAVGLPSSSLQDRESALEEVSQALVHLDALQRIIVAQDPSLEYHFDPQRARTPAMKTIAEHVQAAEEFIQSGRLGEAVASLEHARDLEPPPLVYEMIEKRLGEIKR